MSMSGVWRNTLKLLEQSLFRIPTELSPSLHILILYLFLLLLLCPHNPSFLSLRFSSFQVTQWEQRTQVSAHSTLWKSDLCQQCTLTTISINFHNFVHLYQRSQISVSSKLVFGNLVKPCQLLLGYQTCVCFGIVI